MLRLQHLRLLFLLLLAALPLAGPSAGQGSSVTLGRDTLSLDARGVYAVYGVEAPAFRGLMRAADASSLPVFYGAPVAAWGGVWLLREKNDFADAYRLTLTSAATYAGVKALKIAVGRPRPYARLPGIASRSERYVPGAKGTFESFPSGHAALSFAQVTSWSLSHPRWYVIAPGVAWAASVATSRVWLGVHHPSDVLAGAVLGAALAVLVHELGPHITPAFLQDDAAERAPPMLRLRLP